MDRSPDWLSQARGELAAARDLLPGGHWAWCCFTSQQAAEVEDAETMIGYVETVV